jgi:hypothetical protein
MYTADPRSLSYDPGLIYAGIPHVQDPAQLRITMPDSEFPWLYLKF